MRFKPPNCKRLQGAADARRRARRRTFVLQVPDNKADAGPCERLPHSSSGPVVDMILDKMMQKIVNRLVVKIGTRLYAGQ